MPKTPADLAKEAAAARKARRYAGRRTLWRITGDKACKGCGRNLMDAECGALYVQTAEGASAVLGMMKCARIWLCTVCSATIRQKRAEEITQAIVEWIERGGICYLVTFTARHDYEDRLSDLMDAIQGTRSGSAEEIEAARRAAGDAKAARLAVGTEVRGGVNAARLAAPKGQKRAAMVATRQAAADRIEAADRRVAEAAERLAGLRRQAGAYQRLITGGTWVGRPERGEDGIRDRVGYIGMIRATEVTIGLAHLWHPHIHAIVFVGGALASSVGDRVKVLGDVFEPAEKDLQAWEEHWRATWTSALEKANPKYRPSDECGIPDCKCGGKGHGVDFKRLETVRDAETFGKYVAKTQDGKSPALELARGDLKSGREGNMTPFEVLYRIGDLIGGVAEEDAPGQGSLKWCLGVWHEYEPAVTGRRAIEWTRYLRALLGIEGDDTEDGDMDLLLGADGELGEYRGGARVTEEGVKALTRRGLDFEAVQVAEGTDVSVDPGAVADRLQVVLDMARAPAGSVQPLTSSEVSDAYATMKERNAQRREEGRNRVKRQTERDRERSGNH